MRGSNPIDLSEEKQVNFRCYRDWLYYNLVYTDTPFQRLARMYVLGERLLDREFQDAVLSKMMSRCDLGDELPCATTIKIIYRGTPENSPARRLLADIHGWACTSVDELDLKHTEFIRDMLDVVFNNRDAPLGEYPWIDNPDRYHHRA